MKWIVILFLFIGSFSFSQGKYICRTGAISFEANTPSFEPVEAKSTNGSAILNTSNGDFAALVLVKSFRFRLALMEEHFNENYMESDAFPKITFKGKLQKFNVKRLTATPTPYFVKGTITIRGVTKPLTTKILLSKVDGKINATSAFVLNPEDYNIKIPKVVRKKIAKDVTINSEFTLNPK